MKKVGLHNLGCKVNSYEMEVMRQKLQEKGYVIVPFDQPADIYIVNTCTVTNIADRKSRQMLHRAKQQNPEAVVVAAGCYVQNGRGAVEKDDCVDLAVGNNRKGDIAGILERFFEERERAGGADKTLHGTTVPDIARVREYENMRLEGAAQHTRAYVKIQDGCNQFCSYCAIPYARGRVRCRGEEDVLEEIRGLAAEGCKEAVLTGIHLSSYPRLVELVERIQDIEGLERIRLGSLEPRAVTQEAAGRLAAVPKLCPHFHLSLQSGCDETLKRMNRHYTAGEYYESIEYLRRYFERPAVTTDVIVGFPGETEEEFLRTKSFLRKAEFYEMHVFRYSRRDGTAAASMPGQVAESVKARRSEELIEIGRQQSREFRRAYIGRKAEVLFEEITEVRGKKYLVGHTGDYVRVATALPESGGGGPKPNTLGEVTVTGFLTEDILM